MEKHIKKKFTLYFINTSEYKADVEVIVDGSTAFTIDMQTLKRK